MSKRKYSKGPKLKSVSTLLALLENEEMVFFRDKVYSPGWVWSMQLRYLANEIKAGRVNMALPL
jgi:hypothetical protein